MALSLLGTRFKSRRRTNGQWRASRDKNSSNSGGMSIKSQDILNIDDLKKVRFASRFLRFFHLKVS